MFQASGGKREESLRKARKERERRMREWGSMGGIATPSLAPDLPFVYSPRAHLTRASHARLTRASHTRPHSPKNGADNFCPAPYFEAGDA